MNKGIKTKISTGPCIFNPGWQEKHFHPSIQSKPLDQFANPIVFTRIPKHSDKAFHRSGFGDRVAPTRMASFYISKVFSEKVNVQISQWGWTYVCLILLVLSDISKFVPIFKPLQILFQMILHKGLVRKPGEASKGSTQTPGGLRLREIKVTHLARVSRTDRLAQVLCRTQLSKIATDF